MKQFGAELIGTYGSVFFGTGAIIVNDLYGGIVTHLGVAFVFGAVVMAMIYAFGASSGAHINPAVTIAFWLSGRFQRARVLTYLIAQFIGAVLASLSLKVLFPEHVGLGATVPAGIAQKSFVLEVILTFFLMLVILKVSTGSKELGIMAGAAIGATVMIEALVAGPVSGASMNPARSVAPALVSGDLSQLWVYCIAPVLGAVLAVGVFRLLFEEEPLANSR